MIYLMGAVFFLVLTRAVSPDNVTLSVDLCVHIVSVAFTILQGCRESVQEKRKCCFSSLVSLSDIFTILCFFFPYSVNSSWTFMSLLFNKKKNIFRHF